MPDEQQEPVDAGAEEVPEGAVSAEELMEIPGPPDPAGTNTAGPEAAAEERARQAAAMGETAAAEGGSDI